MERRILLALDGSDTSRRALGYAIDLAKALHASLLGIYVVAHPSAVYSSAYFEFEPFHEAAASDGRRVLGKAQFDMNQAGVEGETRLVDSGMLFGEVAEEIEKVEQEIEADLVVMGTHGRRGFRRMLLGSVAESFVRQSHCPVVLVPHHEQTGLDTAS